MPIAYSVDRRTTGATAACTIGGTGRLVRVLTPGILITPPFAGSAPDSCSQCARVGTGCDSPGRGDHSTSGDAPARGAPPDGVRESRVGSAGVRLRDAERLEVIDGAVDLERVHGTGEGVVAALGDLGGQDGRVRHGRRDLGQGAVAVRALVAVTGRAGRPGQEPLLRSGRVLLLPGVRLAVGRDVDQRGVGVRRATVDLTRDDLERDPRQVRGVGSQVLTGGEDLVADRAQPGDGVPCEVDLVAEDGLVAARPGVDAEAADPHRRLHGAQPAGGGRTRSQVGHRVADHVAVHEAPVRAVVRRRAGRSRRSLGALGSAGTLRPGGVDLLEQARMQVALVDRAVLDGPVIHRPGGQVDRSDGAVLDVGGRDRAGGEGGSAGRERQDDRSCYDGGGARAEDWVQRHVFHSLCW